MRGRADLGPGPLEGYDESTGQFGSVVCREGGLDQGLLQEVVPGGRIDPAEEMMQRLRVIVLGIVQPLVDDGIRGVDPESIGRYGSGVNRGIHGGSKRFTAR